VQLVGREERRGVRDPPELHAALSCWWFSGGSTSSGDLRLNKSSFLWVANIGSACSNKFGIEAVATHEVRTHLRDGARERGHRRLLDDEPTIYACQSSETTLGRGDIAGLETKY
jgi:hypothetical protein